jgi:hypothetical protein
MPRPWVTGTFGSPDQKNGVRRWSDDDGYSGPLAVGIAFNCGVLGLVLAEASESVG